MQPWRAQRGENFATLESRLGHPFSLVSGARSAEKILTTLNWVTCFLWYLARAARRKMLTTLDWVTRFLWYLARAARRKFYFCNLGARSVDLCYHWVSADLKNTKVEPCICRKHDGTATTNLQKVFFSVFFSENPNPQAIFFV